MNTGFTPSRAALKEQRMKKFIRFAFCFLLLTALSGCSSQYMSDPLIPDGYSSKTGYSDGGFQDWTDYYKYQYTEKEDVLFTAAPYAPLQEGADMENLQGYLQDFQSWVAVENWEDKLDFDVETMVQPGDCYFIKNKDAPEPKYWNYTVYYYDVQTHTLYYFQNNN